MEKETRKCHKNKPGLSDARTVSRLNDDELIRASFKARRRTFSRSRCRSCFAGLAQQPPADLHGGRDGFGCGVGEIRQRGVLEVLQQEWGDGEEERGGRRRLEQEHGPGSFQSKGFSELHATSASFRLTRQHLPFQSVFLPQGYPESVSGDYLHYQFWDTMQVTENDTEKTGRRSPSDRGQPAFSPPPTSLPVRLSAAPCRGLWPPRPPSKESAWETRRRRSLRPRSPGC